MRFRFWHLGKGLFFLAALAALGAVLMLLWNAVVPGVFANTHPIDYLQALGLLALSRILFGGFRGHHGHHPGGWHHRGRHWQKWEAMTPEEREQFHRARGHGFGRGHGPGWGWRGRPYDTARGPGGAGDAGERGEPGHRGPQE